LFELYVVDAVGLILGFERHQGVAAVGYEFDFLYKFFSSQMLDLVFLVFFVIFYFVKY